MELLLVAAVLSWVVKNGVTDILYSGSAAVCAVRGKPSPTWGKNSRSRLDGAASKYFSALWSDSWGDALTKHQAKRERRVSPTTPDSSRPRGAATVFLSNRWRDATKGLRRSWDDMWDGAERKHQEKATRPRPGQVTVPGTVVPNVQDGDGDGPVSHPGPEARLVRDGNGRTDLRFGEDEDDPTGTKKCPECRGTVLVDGEICLSCRDRQEQRNQHHEDQSAPDYVPDFGPDQDISPTARPTTTEGPIMTTTIPTGEVTSLSQTIRFCEDSAQAYRAQVHAIEQTQATLAAEEVSGPAAAAFASAMEQSHAAAASMETAADEFKKHLIVLEAYDAVQGAGTKQFVTGGR